MKRNRLFLSVALAAVLVAALVYTVTDRDTSQGQQPSPHAIDQSE